jgi:nucleotide-binding universal stress UspA family protein
MTAAAPQRILVPVGFGPGSDAAVARAAALAAALDAELLLLGVVPLPALGPVIFPPAPDGMAEHENPTDRLTLRRLARIQAGVASGVRSRKCLRWGPAGPAILDAAQHEEVDLVVVPREPGHSLAHPLRDAVDRQVVQHSPVPVLVVPAPAQERAAA